MNLPNLIRPTGAAPELPVLIHHYCVDALCYGGMQNAYSGHDEQQATKTLGVLCMEEGVEKVIVYRDSKLLRYIEVRR